MDKQTLRYTYLNYFKNQLDKNEPIDTKVLMDMAQNINDAAEVIKELKNNGLIEGISIIENNPNHVLMQSGHNVRLTEKGMNYLENKDKNKDAINASTTYEQFLNNERDRISKLSTEAKKEEIKNKILLEYHRINNGLPIYDDNKIEESELKQKIRDTVKIYYPSAPQIIAKQITKDMCLQGYSNYIYSKNDDNKIPIIDLLTKKGKEKVEEVYGKYLNKTIGELTAQEFYKVYGKPFISDLANIKIPPIFNNLYQTIGSLDNTAIKNLQQTINNYSLENYPHLKELQKSIQNINNSPLAKKCQNIQKQLECINQNPELQKIQKGLSQIMNEPDSTLYKELTKQETYTFEGILGQNCGEIISVTGEEPKRIQVKGYKVENGIKVLRGFANSSKIAAFSKVDENYQRDKNDKHLNSLAEFVKNMKVSAKYLPEVTLVARGYENLTPITISGNLSTTQKGEIDNLNLWQLTVNENQLFRIDGNHRIEATKNDNYYIPFSIIIWEESNVNTDDEAFLFYFLNSKSKKLTSEENLKGLVNAQTWSDYELKNANVLLPYIKYFRENFEEHKLFQKDYYKDSEGRENTKIQILKILEIILNEENTSELPFNLDDFGDYISVTQEILSQRDRFKYLREQFRCFPQLVFYTIYKNKGDIAKSIQFISEVNKWAEYYKHDSNSFTLPNKMYHNAKKQLDKKINIFVAMPYYDEATVEQFNKTMQEMVDDLKSENIELKEKLNLYPIMTYKAESTDILANMDEQIGECDIFIADISNHGKNKVNPNVMFELGRVYDKKKFILIRNKDNKVSNSAFDIQHYSYETIDFGMGFDACMKTKLKPRILNIIKNMIGC